jgi:hypothetical protein
LDFDFLNSRYEDASFWIELLEKMRRRIDWLKNNEEIRVFKINIKKIRFSI